MSAPTTALTRTAAGGRGRSANRQIFSALVVVGALTTAAKLCFIARELVIAQRFGTSESLDAFLLAFTFPSFAVTVIAGSFNAALIPTFIHVREQQGRPAAQRLLSNALGFSAALLVGACLLLTLGMPFGLRVLGSRFTPEALALSRRLSYVLLPILVVSGLSTTWGAVLNADDRFALAAVAPTATALLPILSLLLFGHTQPVYALAGGTLAGYVAEAILVGAGLYRRGFSLYPNWHGFDVDTRTVVRQYAPMVAGALVMSSGVLVNQALAGMLGPGNVSSLNYAAKLVSLVVGVGALSLSTAVLPHFSRMVAQKDFDGLRHTLRTYTLLIAATSVPLVIGLAYFSRPLATLAFQRGAFTAHDADVVGQIQAAFVLQIPSYLLGMLLVRLVSSLKANHILLWAAVLNLGVNVVVGFLLAKALGPVGIALTTSIVYTTSYVFLAIMTRRLLREAGTDRLDRSGQ